MEFIEPTITEEEYIDIVIKTLGEYRPHTKHNVVLCKDNGRVVAVFNYFKYNNNIMFLHHCWYLGNIKMSRLKYWNGFFEYSKKRFKYIMGVIDSRNKPALIWGMKTGFDITGCRLDLGKNLIIDVIKEL